MIGDACPVFRFVEQLSYVLKAHLAKGAPHENLLVRVRQLMQQTPYLPCVLTAQQYFIRRFPCFYKLPNICRVFRPAALFQVGIVTVLCNLTQPHANITVAAKSINALQRAKESLAGNILG